MKPVLFAVLCCAVFAGCKKEEKVACHTADCPHVQKPLASAHQHSAACSHAQPAVAPAHQHSASCSHSPKSPAGVAGTQKKSLYDQTEEELAPMIRSAEGGNLKSAYMLSRYYIKKDQAKAEQWIAKTRQLAEQAPAGDPIAARVVQMLDRMEKNPANQTVRTSSENSDVPQKRKEPLIQP